jgi:hypothetical protein
MQDPEFQAKTEEAAKRSKVTAEEQKTSRLKPTGVLSIPKLPQKMVEMPIVPGNKVWGSSWNNPLPFGASLEEAKKPATLFYSNSFLAVPTESPSTSTSAPAPPQTPAGVVSSDKNDWLMESTIQIVIGIAAMVAIIYAVKYWQRK